MKRWRFIGIFLSILLISITFQNCSRDSRPIDPIQLLFDEALKSRAILDYKTALDNLHEILSIDSTYYLAWSYIGSICIEIGDFDQATTAFYNALEINPESIFSYYGLIVTYDFLEEKEKSEFYLQKALQIIPIPESSNDYNGLGNIYIFLKDYDKAILYYTRAIEINPTYDDAYFNRGTGYLTINQLDEAIKDFDKLIRLSPYYIDAFTNRGYAYLQSSKFDRAISDFNKVIKTQPENHAIYHCRSYAYYCLGKSYSYQYQITRILDLNPVKPSSSRGMNHHINRNIRNAMKDINKAIELKPDEAEYYYCRGVIYYDSGDYPSAKKDFQTVVEIGLEENIRANAKNNLNILKQLGY